jgi:uridine phosphorylase
LQESELILNADGSVYHLAILPQDIAPIVITVGDPSRVATVSQFFNKIEVKKSNREFVIHTGTYNNQRITCLSTGMGTDNIDIVLNELDALVNVDLQKRTIKEHHSTLTIVRIGTSGSIDPNTPVGTVLATDVAIGLEGLFSWYDLPEPTTKEQAWLDVFKGLSLPVEPFAFQADDDLLSKFSSTFKPGYTLTTAGFYAPQNRKLRLAPSVDLLSVIANVRVDQNRITNIEMETAGIYGLSKLLGHKAISINAIMANRLTGEFTKNPEEIMSETIKRTLDLVCI